MVPAYMRNFLSAVGNPDIKVIRVVIGGGKVDATSEIVTQLEWLHILFQDGKIVLRQHEQEYIDSAREILAKKGSISETRALIIKNMYYKLAYPLIYP